jgi:hypothetical protein
MQSQAGIELKLKQLKPQLVSEFNVSRIGYFDSYALDKHEAIELMAT